jgi:hypothetical protein
VSLAIAVLFLWTTVVFPAASAFAAAENPTLAKAEDFYLKSQPDEVIRTLRDALAKNQLTGRDKVEARALVARALVRKIEKDAARAEFIEVLDLDPFWVPDELVVPPDEVEVFQDAREEFKRRPARTETKAEPKKPEKKEEAPKAGEEKRGAPPSPIMTGGEGGKKKSKTWIYLLAGGAAIGVAALALGGGGGGGDGDGGGATGTIVISIPVD